VNTGVYRIGTVADLIGVPRNTLLAWERRFGLLAPDRTDSGYRTYSDADVAKLRRIKELIDQGYKISEAVALEGRSSSERQDAGRPGDDALKVLRDDLRERLLAFDRAGAEAIRRRLGLFSFQRAIDEVYLPLLCDVGDGWHAERVTVAQEHFASAFCREQLSAMLHSLGAGPEGGPLAVCAGIPGELHEMGLMSVAVKLALRGWRVIYLGADLPAEELAVAVRAQGASLVCQSVVYAWPRAELGAYLARLRASIDADVRIVIGGAGAEGLEADGVVVAHDLDDALARAGDTGR